MTLLAEEKIMKACSPYLFLVLATLFLAAACDHTASSGSDLASPSEKTGVIRCSEQEVKEFYLKHREQLFDTPRKVWVKAITVPTEEQAEQVRRRAEAGEDFDELIAEYFLPYFFATKGKGRHIDKQVNYKWIDQAGFWRGDDPTGPLSGLHVGDISRICPLYGTGPEFCVLKIIAERPAATASLEDVQDNIYSLMCDALADSSMFREINLGNNPWCGTCRLGYNINGQLWHLVQQYSEQGDELKAVSACLLVLREDRLECGPLGVATKNEQGYFPEEQFLINQGMDLMRYYAGTIDRIIRSQPASMPDALPYRLAELKDPRVVPLLKKLVEHRGRWCRGAAYALGDLKDESTIPALNALLTDRQLQICELGWGDKETMYAYYYLRAAAREALQRMGLDPGEVKVLVGAIHGDPLPEGHLP